jgi:hypothetical protein
MNESFASLAQSFALLGGDARANESSVLLRAARLFKRMADDVAPDNAREQQPPRTGDEEGPVLKE